MAQVIEGCILTPAGFVAGRLRHAQGRVLEVHGAALPETQAAATGLPETWSETSNVAWKTPLPGRQGHI